MKKILIILSISLAYFNANAQPDYAGRVNPMVGTGGHGHTYPGASAPFGMVQLSPDTRLDGWDGCSGYHYSDSVIYGFSHTHLSGTGCSDYGDVLLMPTVLTKENIFDNKVYASAFNHKTEAATAGYYRVLLDKYNIMAELTATTRTGMHRYTFPKTKQATIVIDLKHRDEVLDSYITIVNDSTIKGMRRSKAWATDQYVYFYMQFSKPFKQYTVALNDEAIRSNTANGKNVKAHVDFNLPNGGQVIVKVGISAVSELGAQANLKSENSGWDFDATVKQTRQNWNKELSKIEVTGKPNDMAIFYTALYHCMLNPNVYNDVDGQYRGTDLKIHVMPNNMKNYYSVFSLWDTFRALHPLMTIIDEQRTNDFINTFLLHYENGGLLPVWELSGNETYCMIGYHSVPVIVDAFIKGIKNFDTTKALKAMVHSASTDKYGLPCYRKYGFLSNDCEHESVSKTLEYAYDDWCIATYAAHTGHPEIYTQFINRSQYYRNVYNPQNGFMQGKNNGMFTTGFEPSEVNNYYTEANSWQYSFFVPHDVTGLMQLHGGKQKFASKLDALFKADQTLKGRQQADITGLMGQYAHGNEPSHHIAYLYNFADKWWQTQQLTYNICRTFYQLAPDGLSGNEDCGQMSAWYVLSSMGFYQVCPGKPEYSIGTTLFDKTKIHLENGKTFTINAVNRTDNNRIVETITCNDTLYNKSYFTHNDIKEGKSFTFYMQEFLAIDTTRSFLQPPATTVNQSIVTAPVLHASGSTFRGETSINITCNDALAQIMASQNGADFTPFTPTVINKTTEIQYYAKTANDSSAIITTKLLQIPGNRHIQMAALYDNQYTAGGNDALIDGLRGDENWRKGSWQGYANKTLDAVVDLGKSMFVSEVSLGCLQDVGPWIFYPSSITFSCSNDGVNFKSLPEIIPAAPKETDTVSTTNFKAEVMATYRYIKVIAKPFGPLPTWHISAGQPAWLFIDEINIK
jgi:predicted alpha-1,2-mannosidase